MIKNYFKIAWRNLFKDKGYTFINIMGLATGIAICVLIFRFVSHELSYDRFHQKSDRIYRLTLQLDQYDLAVTPSIALPLLQKKFTGVETGVRVYDSGGFSPVVIKHDNKIFEERRFGYADSTFFDVFSFKLLSGNPEKALSRPNTIVISRTMARKYFGNENPIGKALTINNKRQYEVTGVMQDMPDNSHFQMDFIASLVTLSSWNQLVDNEIQGAQFYTYVVLNKGTSPSALETKVNSYLHKNYPAIDDAGLGFQPLTDIHLHSDLKSEIQPQGSIEYVWAASAIALLILFIACINYMNLATARSARRSQEVGIRKVLGSDRKRLIVQFYGESAFIAFWAILVSVLLIELLNPWFNQIIGEHINASLASPRVLGLLAIIGFAITLLAGSYPALLLSSFRPASVLKGNRSSNRNSSLRKGLVIFQFAVSVVLIISTLVINRQVNYVEQKNLGYQKDNVIVLTSYSEVENRFDTFKSLLQQHPGIQQATMVSETPTHIQGGYSIDVEGVQNSDRNIIAGLRARYDFTAAMGIDLVAGRALTKADYEQANPKVGDRKYAFLVNQSMAKYLGLSPQELLGRRTKVNGRVGTIVGVVRDFHFAPLHEKIGPLVIFPQAGFNKLMIRFNTTNPKEALQNTRKEWQKLFPNYPFNYQFLNQEYDALYAQDIRAGQAFGRFAFLAIFIACLGLLGLSAYTVEQRTKEIGIRKVLGASAPQLLVLLSKEFTKLVLIAITIAIPLGWWIMSNWLQDFAYRTDIKVWQFVTAGGAALVVAWLTVSWQSVRAALMNPVNSLRNE